jgi:glutamate-5-semialdehyde dehydrogenase
MRSFTATTSCSSPHADDFETIMSTAKRNVAPTLMEQMLEIGRSARAAAEVLARAQASTKRAALLSAAAEIRGASAAILRANAEDVAEAKTRGLSGALIDRLALDPKRVEATAAGVASIAEFPDPIGEVIAEWQRPNGLTIERVRVPLGVIGIVYESRPNVTADAAALCLKSGNAVILRGGSESVRSNRAIHQCLVRALGAHGIPAAAVQLVPTQDREAVGILLRDMAHYIDLIVPRGGKDLIARVQQDARVPVMSHLEGICHTYVHAAADLAMARSVTLNAKMRRTGICGATETVLVDRACAPTHLGPLVVDLLDAGCEVRGDAATQACDRRVVAATDGDWGKEFLDAIVAVRVVAGLDEALAHIRRYGSAHTEAIITEDAAAAQRFLSELDSAILMHNTSTQFADGCEFGMGAEIGIATGKIHARGPVGATELTSYKYLVRGNGQIRP